MAHSHKSDRKCDREEVRCNARYKRAAIRDRILDSLGHDDKLVAVEHKDALDDDAFVLVRVDEHIH